MSLIRPLSYIINWREGSNIASEKKSVRKNMADFLRFYVTLTSPVTLGFLFGTDFM